MAPRKTNLWKGDRVRLSKTHINRLSILGFFRDETLQRVGTITSDTLSKRLDCIQVHWDGNKCAHAKDEYDPEDLVLVEEEEIVEYRRSPYALLIVFLSNENPFRWTHDAYKIYDDTKALLWAEGMAEGLGHRYRCTLLKDGEIMKEFDPESIMADGT